MKAIQYYIAVMACLLLSLGFSHQAKAEISIAVVDVQKIMTESKAAVSIQQQVQQQREKLQTEFSGYEQKLRDNEKNLLEERNDMTPEEFKAKRDEFQKNLQETGALVQDKKRALEEGLVKATSKLRGEVLQIVANMADERNYDIVMSRQNIVLVTKSLDITEEVMAAINAKITNISLELGK